MTGTGAVDVVDTPGTVSHLDLDWASPPRAVRCALAIVDGVRQLGPEVRAGLHTGECEWMGDGARVGGLAVHFGARALSGRAQ